MSRAPFLRLVENVEAPSPAPLWQLPDDSDHKATERLYTAEQLADVEFVYLEMLMMRAVADLLIDEQLEGRE